MSSIEFLKTVSLKSYVTLNNIIRIRERVNPKNPSKKSILLEKEDGEISWMRASSKLDPSKPMMICYCKSDTEEFALMANESEANFTEIQI